jgi:tRNA-2-methylthio-N6-dimethylallyladenosine synthase
MNFFIKTFGCQMNVNDSEKIRYILEEKGFSAVGNETDADIVIINSCAVREKPQEKIFSYAGRIPKHKIIVVAGCVAQVEKENILKKNPHIHYIVGTHGYHQIGSIIEEIGREKKRGVKTGFSKQWQELIPYAASRESKVSGYISIMEGCDNFCSYCIVPFTRGREKYRPFADIMREAEYLSTAGYREIILLGQNVNNWRDERENKKFPDLLDDLARAAAVKWIRFITSYPGYYDDELIAVMAEHERIARHIHFPAQSGSTRILKKMNRVYSRAQYLRIIEDFKKKIPAIKFSSDFIVGYPGETERDFRLTLSLIEKVEYESLFSFMYSPRKFTRAYKTADNIPLDVKKERLHRLQDLQETIQLRNNKKLIGAEIEALVSGPHPKKSGEVIGRTESYQVVNFISGAAPGEIRKVSIKNVGPYSLRGEEI